MRRPPIKHVVRSHIRNGVRVQSYVRGSRSPLRSRIAKPTLPTVFSEIPAKIRRFIDSIPENGAVEVAKNSWGNNDRRKAIGKINGRLEFFEFDDETAGWDTVYTWYFLDEPERWEDHFDISSMPKRTGKVFRGVFI